MAVLDIEAATTKFVNTEVPNAFRSCRLQAPYVLVRNAKVVKDGRANNLPSRTREMFPNAFAHKLIVFLHKGRPNNDTT